MVHVLSFIGRGGFRGRGGGGFRGRGGGGFRGRGGGGGFRGGEPSVMSVDSCIIHYQVVVSDEEAGGKFITVDDTFQSLCLYKRPHVHLLDFVSMF